MEFVENRDKFFRMTVCTKQKPQKISPSSSIRSPSLEWLGPYYFFALLCLKNHTATDDQIPVIKNDGLPGRDRALGFGKIYTYTATIYRR